MSEKIKLDKYRVLVCCTGSVAAVNIPDIVNELLKLPVEQIEVKVAPTEKSLKFFDPNSLPVKVVFDEDEWTANWRDRSILYKEPVLHIELRKWADIILIAPLNANTLAKIANGISDNLLTCVLRVYKPDKPVLFATAMNVSMWDHPITNQHIETLKQWGYTEIPCIKKKLACGDIGFGGLAETTTIVTKVYQSLLEMNGIEI
ncbi:phosphopantothenoylcysteine decarboxylase-like [Tubulanus polymorphus]|uniref:phosphopantothenoylcysteine decarboxylase-like n=1 Tax=Tubulanus polymorphus TaxID=672921 RepID=UPI003DA5EF0A